MVSGNSDGGASREGRSSSARCLTARGLARCTQHPMEAYTRHSTHVSDKDIEREGCCALWSGAHLYA